MRVNRKSLRKRRLCKEYLAMGNMPVVILLDNNTLVKSRIRNIFKYENVRIYEAYNSRELLRILNAHDNKIDLIITEIEFDNGDGFNGIDIIRLVKSRSSSIPVVVLSSIGRTEVISEALLKGASDYILKPFQDEYLKTRLLKYINFENLMESAVLQFNLKNYLESEIYKAKKQNYCFSLLKVQFDYCAEEESASPKNGNGFHYYDELLFREMKSLFWESDIYVRLGKQCHLGIFPFCDQENAEILIEKIKSGFESCKSIEPRIGDYYITHSFATYPVDGETASDLLNNLSESGQKKS